MLDKTIIWIFGFLLGIQTIDLYGVKFIDYFLFFYFLSKIFFSKKICNTKFTIMLGLYLTLVLIKTFFQDIDLILATQQLIRFLFFWATVEFCTEITSRVSFEVVLDKMYHGMLSVYLLGLGFFGLEKFGFSFPYGFTTIHTAYPGRFKGFYLDPNYLTTMILVMISILVFLKKRGVLNLFNLGAMYLGVLYTVSRSGTFFITMALIPVVFQIINRNRYISLRYIKIKVCLIFGLILGICVYLSDSIFSGLINPYIKRLSAITANAIDERSMLRDVAYQMIADNLNLGVGFGNFRVFSINYMSSSYEHYIKNIDAHNTYLNELATNGIWIFGLYLYILLYPLVLFVMSKKICVRDVFWAYLYGIFLMFGLMLNIETSRVFFAMYSLVWIYFSNKHFIVKTKHEAKN